MVATDFIHLQFHAVRSKKKLAVLDSCEIAGVTWKIFDSLKWWHSGNHSGRCDLVSTLCTLSYCTRHCLDSTDTTDVRCSVSMRYYAAFFVKNQSLEFHRPTVFNKKLFSVQKMRNHWKKLFKNITSGIRTLVLFPLPSVLLGKQVFFVGVPRWFFQERNINITRRELVS